MREIKFRAWAYKNKMMYNLVRVGGMPQTIPSWYSGERGWVDLWLDSEKDGELMQFTGLLDKNGKEIYEGDIVLLEDVEKIPITDDGQGPTEDANHLAPIVFANGCFGLDRLCCVNGNGSSLPQS